jgi:copper chaperone CopZ
MNKLKFKTNINCNNCIRSVTPFLNSVDSIEEWSVDIDNPEKILTVDMEGGSKDEVIQAVVKAGFEIKTAE